MHWLGRKIFGRIRLLESFKISGWEMKALKTILFLLIAFVLFVTAGHAFTSYLDETKTEEILNTLSLPDHFEIKFFAGHTLGQRLAGARMMAMGPDGHLYVSLTKQNKVVMLPDLNQDGVADKIVMVAEHGLNAPHGLAFVHGQLYVANQDSVVALVQENNNWPAAKIKPIIQNLPTGGHSYKSLRLGPDGYLYVNVGSSFNVCEEDDATRATILRFTTDGKPAGAVKTLGRHAQSAVWASGLRNSQGFQWHPITKAMYATNEGSDNRSEIKHGRVNDELPPEHLNVIEPNKHYGWPYCWGKQFADPNFEGSAGFCATTQAPAITFTSHSTPIGFSFLHTANVPKAYQADAIVALHGSWNRASPSGYKLVRVKFNAQHQPEAVEDFITGWLKHGQLLGRPVDVMVGKEGVLYVSDDKLGVVYRITHKP